MLSIEECRQYFKKTKLTDEELEKLRNQLYALIGQIVDNNLETIKNAKSNNLLSS